MVRVSWTTEIGAEVVVVVVVETVDGTAVVELLAGNRDRLCADRVVASADSVDTSVAGRRDGFRLLNKC